jgi:hypothetical protein
MAVYVDAIIQQRACFFLKPPYKNYRAAPTNPHSCDNLLPPEEYSAPLNPALVNRHPNTTYNVVLFGDSMVAYSYTSFNLTGRIRDFLPQYANNLRFFNEGQLVSHPTSLIHTESLVSTLTTTTYHYRCKHYGRCYHNYLYAPLRCTYHYYIYHHLPHPPLELTAPNSITAVRAICAVVAAVADDEYRYRSGSLP